MFQEHEKKKVNLSHKTVIIILHKLMICVFRDDSTIFVTKLNITKDVSVDIKSHKAHSKALSKATIFLHVCY